MITTCCLVTVWFCASNLKENLAMKLTWCLIAAMTIWLATYAPSCPKDISWETITPQTNTAEVNR